MYDTFFVVVFAHDERRGENIQCHNMRTIIGPPAKRHKMPFSGPILNAGFVIFLGIETSIAKKPFL